MLQWLFLRCQSWKCTCFPGRTTCQVVIAQSKGCKAPQRPNVCWKNYRCHLGMLRALNFQAETAALPPELQPYKANPTPRLPQLNQPDTHRLFPWLTGIPLAERQPHHGKNTTTGRTELIPILNWPYTCHKAAMNLAVGRWGRRHAGSGVEIFRLPREISHKSYPFIPIYSHSGGSNKLKKEFVAPFLLAQQAKRKTKSPSHPSPACALKFTGRFLLIRFGAHGLPVNSCVFLRTN